MASRTIATALVLKGACIWLLVLLGLGATRAVEARDWLVLLVDRSNSIDTAELALQRNAYIRLLSDPVVVQALVDTRVAIVEFDTRPELIVEWADAATAARLYQRKSPDGLRGQTGIGHAMTSALALLTGKNGRLIIDISGDGRENVDPALLASARATAADSAIEVNGLAIRTEDTPDLEAYYSHDVVTGFVLGVDRPEDFYGALRRKLFFEVAGLPPPLAELDVHAIPMIDELRR